MPDDIQRDRHSVLEVFGLKLEVSNPRLAELLTMDAGDALTSDVKDIFGGPIDREVFEQGAPEAMLTTTTPRDNHAEMERRRFRARAEVVGNRLGFDVRSDGTWTSPTGVEIYTRTVERPLSLAAAVHFVSEVAALERPESEHSVLFVVDSQQTADVFKVAIRQRKLYHLMRTATADSLDELAELMGRGVVDHRRVVVLLAPVADIDVGEMLSVIHANQGDVL